MSGGIPNFVLAYSQPEEVRDYCRKVIDQVAQDGGYVMDASAIMQDDTSIENMKVLTDFTREYGVYSSSSSLSRVGDSQITPPPGAVFEKNYGMPESPDSKANPGVCIPWKEKLKELPEISGDIKLVQRVWEDIDALGNLFIWHCLLSF